MNLKKQFSLIGKRKSSWWQNVWPLFVVFFFLFFPIILVINLLYFSGYLEPPPTIDRTEELFKGLMMGIALPTVFSAVAGSFFFLWGAIIDNSMNKLKSEDTVARLNHHFVSVLRRILIAWFVPFFLVLFGLSVVRGFSLMGTTQRAQGVVVSFAETRNYRGDRLLAPRISFVTSDGRSTKVTSRISSFSPRYQVGDEVAVMYRPSNPSAADIWSPTVLWFPSLLTCGCLILVIAIVVFLQKKQNTGKQWTPT